jgi:hypothetical protein
VRLVRHVAAHSHLLTDRLSRPGRRPRRVSEAHAGRPGAWSGGTSWTRRPRPGEFFPIIHTLFSNINAWLVGTHHGVSAKHLPRICGSGVLLQPWQLARRSGRLSDPPRRRMCRDHQRSAQSRRHGRWRQLRSSTAPYGCAACISWIRRSLKITHAQHFCAHSTS